MITNRRAGPVARILTDLDVAEARLMENPAHDLGAIKADVLHVDPEVLELHLQVARVRGNEDETAAGLERSSRGLDEAADSVSREVLDQVRSKDTIEARLVFAQVLDSLALHRAQSPGVDGTNHAVVRVDP